MQCFKAHRIKSILNEFVCCFISDIHAYIHQAHARSTCVSNERMLLFQQVYTRIAVAHLSYGFLSSILLLLFYQRGNTKCDPSIR